MLSRVLPILILSTFLTDGHAIAAPDRRAYVKTGNNQLFNLIDFLTRSPSFRARLDSEESQQLLLMRGLTFAIANNARFGEQLGPAARIEFSDDASMFKLNPNEPERSAMTTALVSDPIYFNLRLLNAPGANLTYLNILQILIHEFSHKLGVKKNQVALESMAAKAVNHLKPYYIQSNIMGGNNLRVEMLSLPEVVNEFLEVPISSGWFFVQENERVQVHRIDRSQFISAVKAFTMSEEGSGNFSESFTWRIRNLKGPAISANQLAFELTGQFEASSSVVVTMPETDLIPIGPGINGQQFLFPQNKRLRVTNPFQRSAQFTFTANRPHDNRAYVPQIYPLTIKAYSYPDLSAEGQVVRASLDGEYVEAELSMTSAVQSAWLRVRSKQGELLITGEAVGASESGGLYRFPISGLTSLPAGELSIGELVLDSRGTLPLPEVLRLISKEALVENVDFGDLKVKIDRAWVKAIPEAIENLGSGPIHMRLTARSSSPLKQIVLHCSKGASLAFWEPHQIFGVVGGIEYELISKFTRTGREGDFWIYEFVSNEIASILLPKVPQGIIASDSGRRALTSVSVTTSSLATEKRRYFEAPWLPNRQFLRIQPSPDDTRTCHKLL